jgi:O-antigen ligase
VLTLGSWRWGRWLLYAGLAALLAGFLTLPLGSLLKQIDASTSAYAAGGINMAARLEIWSRAVQALGDYPYTGMGLGTFRVVAPLLYPLFSVPSTYDIAHAHNFFLQTALDLGLLGLVAVLAIYLLAVAQSIMLWWRVPFAGSRPWALGLVAALAGQAVYSLADAVALGAKTNFLFWFLLALLSGAAADLFHHSRPKSR